MIKWQKRIREILKSARKKSEQQEVRRDDAWRLSEQKWRLAGRQRHGDKSGSNSWQACAVRNIRAVPEMCRENHRLASIPASLPLVV